MPSCAQGVPAISDSRRMAIAGLAVAMAALLHQWSLVRLPWGGAITLASVVPIVCASRLLGFRWGLYAGATLGCFELIVNPYVVHPVQMLLDYPLAYGCLGLSALTPWPSLGLVIGVGARYACHVASGAWFFWAQALTRHQDPWVYSALYNSFLIPDALIALVVLEAIIRRAPAMVGQDEPPPTMGPKAIGAAVAIAVGYSVILVEQLVRRR